MSSKRAKLTADKARARITSLEESIVVRAQKLDQLHARIARSANPEEKLLKARERLERRLQLEKDQVQKLKRLLSRRDESPTSQSFVSEEYDELHRSFEVVKQDLTKVKARLENADLPRDLPSRLTSFEERISKREAADSDLFSQILEFQSALDQERQTVRRLSRRIREQDQSLDALREAVEDSVVATVDLAERLEEIEENLNEDSPTPDAASKIASIRTELSTRLEGLQERMELLNARVSTAPTPVPKARDHSGDIELMLEALQELDSRLEILEERPTAVAAEETKAIESPDSKLATEQIVEPSVERPSTPDEVPEAQWVPAKFCGSNGRGRLVAKFSSHSPPKGSLA